MDTITKSILQWYVTPALIDKYAVVRMTPNGLEYSKDSHDKIIYCHFEDIAQMLADYLNRQQEQKNEKF